MKTEKLAIGALIGAVFVLLFAPQKGRNVRMQIKRSNDGLEPLARGYKNLFSEFFRVVTMRIPHTIMRNPFTVTSLKK
ncbi:YtxH domain-containing protein [bacterium]|nr:YtxH domain-containing protein [bacterium]